MGQQAHWGLGIRVPEKIGFNFLPGMRHKHLKEKEIIFPNAARKKKNSQPAFHDDINLNVMNAATIQAFWRRELNELPELAASKVEPEA